MVVEELFAKLGIDVDQAGMSRAVAAIGSLRAGMIAIGAAAAGLGVALVSAVKATADYGDAMLKGAQRTGAATDVFQAMSHAADLAGASVGDLQTAVNFLARKGSKDPIRDFESAADAIKALFDAGRGKEAPRAAIDRLGRSGAALIPLLKGGAAGFREAMDEARALGLVLDQETLEASEALNDSVTRAQGSLRGLAYSLGAPLLKPLRELIDSFTAWMKANRQIIAARIQAAFTLIGRAVQQVVKVLQPFIALVRFLVTNTWALRVAALAFAAVLVGQVGSALAAFAAGLSLANVGLLTMIANQLRATAVGLAWVLALAAALLLLEDIWGFFQGKDSLVGRWAEWVDKFTQGSTGDHWILRTLKRILGYITNVQLLWQDFQNQFEEWFGKRNSILRALFWPANDVMGGGATPAASVGSSVNAPRTVAPISITQTLTPTQPTDMSSPDFVRAVADQSAENIERAIGEAAWGLPW